MLKVRLWKCGWRILAWIKQVGCLNYLILVFILVASPLHMRHPITPYQPPHTLSLALLPLSAKDPHCRERPTLQRKRVKCGHAIFLLMVQQILTFYSLKPSASQEQSSLKISAHQVQLFWRSQGTHRLTHSLTFYYFYRFIIFFFHVIK